MAKVTRQKKVRFFRSGLPTVCWDPEKNCALAEFKDGTFTTDDPRTIKRLREAGYPEVSQNAQRPPQELVDNPVTEEPAPQKKTAFSDEQPVDPVTAKPEYDEGAELDEDVLLEDESAEATGQGKSRRRPVARKKG